MPLHSFLKQYPKPVGGFLRVFPASEAGEAYIFFSAAAEALAGRNDDLRGPQQIIEEGPSALPLRTGQPDIGGVASAGEPDACARKRFGENASVLLIDGDGLPAVADARRG